jgi:hypothetical protein
MRSSEKGFCPGSPESFVLMLHPTDKARFIHQPFDNKEDTMKKNMGLTDRILRILFALVVGILILTSQIEGTIAIVLGLFGGIFLLTALAGTCPLYLLGNFSTKKSEKTA